MSDTFSIDIAFVCAGRYLFDRHCIWESAMRTFWDWKTSELKEKYWNNLSNSLYLFQFARLARDLKFPGGITTSRSAATTSCYSQGADDEGKEENTKGGDHVEEDEIPSELCWAACIEEGPCFDIPFFLITIPFLEFSRFYNMHFVNISCTLLWLWSSIC